MNPLMLAQILQILSSRLGGGEHYSNSKPSTDNGSSRPSSNSHPSSHSNQEASHPSNAPSHSYAHSSSSTEIPVDRGPAIVSDGLLAGSLIGSGLASILLGIGIATICLAVLRRIKRLDDTELGPTAMGIGIGVISCIVGFAWLYYGGSAVMALCFAPLGVATVAYYLVRRAYVARELGRIESAFAKFWGWFICDGQSFASYSSAQADRIESGFPGYEQFLQRVPGLWIRMQEEWCTQKLSSVRACMTDGVYERLSVQVGFLKKRKIADRIRLEGDLEVRIVHFQEGTIRHNVTVRISGVLKDEDIDLRTGKSIREREVTGPFVEYWTFMKSGEFGPGKQKGLLEGNCPACGGMLQPNGSAKCDKCGAWIRAGIHDWVLVEITMEEEWRPWVASEIEGLSHLAERDPDFSVSDLEDQASVLFWRTVTALDENRFLDLAKQCDAVCVQELSSWRSQQVDVFRVEPLVGSMELIAIRPAGDLELAVVRVKWQPGPDSEWPGKSKPISKRTMTSHWTLMRPANGATNPLKLFAATHCSACGAADNNTDGGICPYCGVRLDPAELGWRLHRIESGFKDLGI